ncbi:hypothetical protein CLPU_3c02140 [Gottschalkia purinilytica]|uniref:Uncharacterized protein n=1 Tax=Gottschalkia purinilytica TaxID=1503 RepID=A0A0L0WDB5_GOTPU|nr:hypothetical protein [Gottschalkia purinilytica]KNF09435.1 hypothetical protein CLPU_3c02140 [Gottschalkia purinilytica]
MKEKSHLREIKNLYENGFRCIRYDNGEDGKLTVHLKNFEDEKIDTLIYNDEEQILQIKNFIDEY